MICTYLTCTPESWNFRLEVKKYQFVKQRNCKNNWKRVQIDLRVCQFGRVIHELTSQSQCRITIFICFQLVILDYQSATLK